MPLSPTQHKACFFYFMNSWNHSLKYQHDSYNSYRNAFNYIYVQNYSPWRFRHTSKTLVGLPYTMWYVWYFKIWPSIKPSIVTVFLLLVPHPSWLYVLIGYHLQVMHQPFIFTIHLLVSYTLTFMIFSSLIVCVARDPGFVYPSISQLEGEDEEEVGLTEALMPDRDFESPERWCRKCWVRGKTRTQ